MTEAAKQQSNPFSTGAGGPNFETRVQAMFTVFMLSGGFAPCLPRFPITKIKLQGRYAGFNTDDLIVFVRQPEIEKEAKLLAQIKHDISITGKDAIFAEVIQSTWNDFNDESFDSSTDTLALITGPLSATDRNDVRPILEWARHAENEEEFFVKINTANFSSDAKRKKLEAFRTHLKTANDETDVPDRQLWEFLKVFHIIGYDLDTESGSTLSLLHSLIAQYSNDAALSLWARVVDVVQIANQNAGTLTLETLPEDIRIAFSPVNSSSWSSSAPPDWREVGRATLNLQKQRTIDVLTGGDGPPLDETFVPLGLIERHKCDSRASQPNQGETEYKVTQKFHKQEEFFDRVLCQGQSSKSPKSKGRRIAIIGESGSGKTALLLKIGFWILDNTQDVPIWVSLKDLGEKTLDQYLKEDWLSKRGKTLEEWEQLLKNERVCLLLDGVEDLTARLTTPLREIASQLTGLTDNARVLLTCRTSVWKEELYTLDAFCFDTYQNLGLNPERVKHPERVKQFIKGWFSGNSELVQQLQAELDQPRQWRIKDLAQNPLHLVLLCRTWQRRQGKLPETKVELFELFIKEDCKRKVESRFPIYPLIKALGELALKALNQKQLRHSLVCQKLGEDGLQLVLQLGWLRLVGEHEEVYDFLHDSFKEYFAAEAINKQWDYFLKHIPTNPKDSNANYCIFQPQWKEVFLLWMGHPEEELRQQQEELIEALVKFEDNCCSFYRYRAIFLAAAGIAEFSKCHRATSIVDFIMELVFDEDKRWNPLYKTFSEAARQIILDTDLSKVIEQLIPLIEDPDGDELIYIEAASILEDIGIPENRVIEALFKLITTSQSRDVRECTTSCLKRIGTGNQKLIDCFLKLLREAKQEYLRDVAVDCLEDVAVGNQKAINDLVILSNHENDNISWRAAYVLAQISPGNEKALSTLVRILSNYKNDNTSRELLISLGRLITINQGLIATLARILLTNDPKSITCEVIQSIAEIVSGNKNVLDSFVDLMLNEIDREPEIDQQKTYFLDKSVDSLGKAIENLNSRLQEISNDKLNHNRTIQKLQLIVKKLEQSVDWENRIDSLVSSAIESSEASDPNKLLQKLSLYKRVKVFKKYLVDAVSENNNDEQIYYTCKILWHCAQNMTYPEFYDAWHSPSR